MIGQRWWRGRDGSEMDHYQVALWPGAETAGERACVDRWEMLEPELPDAGVVLDVGANIGYFAIRTAESRPQVAVVSLESSLALARRQAAIAAARRTDRLCVVAGALDAARAEAWAATCDVFDAVFLLAVAHWFDDPARVLAALSAMSGRLFLELPDGADEQACGPDRRRLWGDRPDAWVAAVTGRPVRVLGRPARHTGPVPSWLLCVDGPVERRPERPYLGAQPNPDRQRYRVLIDGDDVVIEIRGRRRDRVAGVNLVNLMAMGRLVYPSRRTWTALGRAALVAAPGHRDPGLHNMLWGPAGITLVDGDDLDGHYRAPRYALAGNLRNWAAGRPYRPELGRAGGLPVWIRAGDRLRRRGRRGGRTAGGQPGGAAHGAWTWPPASSSPACPSTSSPGSARSDPASTPR